MTHRSIPEIDFKSLKNCFNQSLFGFSQCNVLLEFINCKSILKHLNPRNENPMQREFGDLNSLLMGFRQYTAVDAVCDGHNLPL